MHPYVRGKLKELAESRNRVFRHLQRNRPLSKDYEDVGLAGEWEFGRWSGIFPKTKPGGDGGVDFELPVVFTVDVKTSRKGDCLLVEEGKVKADIYVLAHYEGDWVCGDDKTQQWQGNASLVGWTFATAVKATPAKDTGRGIVNHCIAREDLRPLSELEKMIGKVKRG